jgi:farnesyl diphosphate synthase
MIAAAECLAPEIARSNEKGLLQAAAALELIHCYSLVHDDLPAMDDDDLRRGQPTVHKAFDEATAILAGDALLTLAFDRIADAGTGIEADLRLQLVTGLARAAGVGGMVGGQILDLAAEGRYDADGRPQELDETAIRRLQAMKTGALLRFACEAGAIFVGAPEETRQHMTAFGRLVGQAFQIADDIIDVESATETAGKTTGKDAARGKATLVSLHGLDAARARLDHLVREAEAVLGMIGGDAALLSAAARFIATRSF